MNNNIDQSSSQEFVDELIIIGDNLLDKIYLKDNEEIEDKYVFVNRFIKYLLDNKYYISIEKFIEVSIKISNFEISNWFLDYYLKIFFKKNTDSIQELILQPTELIDLFKQYISTELIDTTCYEIVESNLLQSIECINTQSIIDSIKDVMIYRVSSYNDNIKCIEYIINLYYEYRSTYYNNIIIDIY